MADEKIILEIYVNTADAKKQIDELKATIEKQNDALTDMKKGTDSYKKLSGSIKENKDSISNLTKIVKEQESAQRSLDKQRQQALAQIAKQEQKQRDLIAAANMEVKTDKDLEVKLAAMINLRKNIDKTTADGVAQYDAMTLAIKELDKAVKENDASSGRYHRNVGNYAGAIETANMSLGEMKRTLKELRNMPLVGKTEAEIQQINATMAKLTDEIDDYGAKLKSSGDKVSLMIEATQGFIAVSQMASGALAAFGYNTEKLEKAMVQLIGVSQALATIHQLNEKQVLQNTIATIKDTYAKVANAVAAKGQMMATNGATAATRALGSAMNKVPFVAIAAAILAVVAGIVSIAMKMKEANIETKKHKLAMEEYKSVQDKIANATGENVVKLKLLTETVRDNTLSENTRKKALKEIYDLTNGQVAVYGLSEASLKSLDIQTQKYIETLKLQAKAQALTEVAIEQYKKYYELKSKEVTSTKDLKDKQQELLLLEQKINATVAESAEINKIATDAANNEVKALRTVAEIESNIAEFKTKQFNAYYAGRQKEFKDKMSLYEDELAAAKSMEAEKTKNANLNSSARVEKERYDTDLIVEINFEAAQRMLALNQGTWANYLEYLRNRQAADQSYYDYKAMLDNKATAEREKMETERNEAIKAGVKQAVEEYAAAHAKEIEELKAYNELRRQLGLISDGTIYDEKLEALKDYLEKKYITEQEYDKLSRQMENERKAAEIKSFQDKFQMAVEIQNSLSSLVQSSMDAQLQTLEGNEEAQAEVRKKYADAIFATKISEMAINGLMSITSIWATWGAYPPVAALLTGLSLAATIPAIVKATAERNKMRGFADGGYTGEGSKYTPAGIVHKGEVVFSKEDVKLLGGVKKTDSLRPTSNANMQYFTGGIVGFGNTSTAKNETNYAMVEAVKNLQIVATIEDINAGLSSEQNRISISRI
jgi:hypothetical protein